MATENEEVTDVNSWKKAKAKPVTMPSGNRARLRLGGMQFFLQAGFIPNSLKGMIQQAIRQVDGNSPAGFSDADAAAILDNEDQLRELLEMYDKVAIYCFLEPELHPLPNAAKGEERDEDLLYVDEVDFEDKVFVFNFAVGGTRDLEKFRQQQNESVELVRASAAVGNSAE